MKIDSATTDSERAPAHDLLTTSGAGTRIQSVARACQLLLWVAEQPRGATAKEIAIAQRLALPTTYHLVNTLADQGLLAKADGRRYILGESAAVLAQAYLRGRAVPEALLSAVHELAEVTRETTYLADWGEHDIRVLASIEGGMMVRVAEVASGRYEDAHARANGKVLLAYAPDELREGYLASHPARQLTPTTITDPGELDRELRRIRRRGHAFDQEEFALGVSCVAAPVLQNGRLVAALGIAVPTERFKKRRQELAAALREVIGELEEANPAER
jgi:IclR family acetate operon transcriptional repressor